MVRVLFVCLGNICRSPMAEAVFRHKVKEAGLADNIQVDSAGTGPWHEGDAPHDGTQEQLQQHGIDFTGMQGRQIRQEDLQTFDYIIPMDAYNLGDLHRMAGYTETGYIARLLDFLPDEAMDDVPDPFYEGGFSGVYRLIDEGSSRLLTFIREREAI